MPHEASKGKASSEDKDAASSHSPENPYIHVSPSELGSTRQDTRQHRCIEEQAHCNSATSLIEDISLERAPETPISRSTDAPAIGQGSSGHAAADATEFFNLGLSYSQAGIHHAQRSTLEPSLGQPWSLSQPWINQTMLFRDVRHNLSKLSSLQKEAIPLRLLIQQLRKQLRDKRELYSKTDADFVALLFQNSAAGSTRDAAAIRQVYDAVQDARNALGPVEDRCERLEIELGRIELALLERSGEIEGQLGSLGLNALQRKDVSSSEVVSSHYSFETDLPDKHLMHLPKYSRSEVDLQEQTESTWVSDNYTLPQRVEGPQDLTLQNFSIQQAQDQGQANNPKPPENMKAAQSSRPRTIFSAPEPSYEMPSVRRNTDLEKDIGLSFMRPVGTDFAPSASTWTHISSTLSSESEDLEDLGKLQDIESAQSRVNRWVLGVLLASKLERRRYESRLPTDVSMFSVHPKQFLKLWDADSAIIAYDMSSPDT